MSYPIAHVVVKDNPPPQRPVMTVGHIYPIVQETVFKTVDREVEEDLEEIDDEAEVKVVRRGRRPKPKANEAAEVK